MHLNSNWGQDRPCLTKPALCLLCLLVVCVSPAQIKPDPLAVAWEPIAIPPFGGLKAALILGSDTQSQALGDFSRSDHPTVPNEVIRTSQELAAAGFTVTILDAYNYSRLEPSRAVGRPITRQETAEALNGASLVAYWGHGIHRSDTDRADVGGLFINCGPDLALRNFNNEQIAQCRLAPNAAVLFSYACDAAGGSSGEHGQSLDLARARVANYADPFVRAGARLYAATDIPRFVGGLLRGATTEEAFHLANLEYVPVLGKLPNSETSLWVCREPRATEPDYARAFLGDPKATAASLWSDAGSSSALPTVDVFIDPNGDQGRDFTPDAWQHLTGSLFAACKALRAQADVRLWKIREGQSFLSAVGQAKSAGRSVFTVTVEHAGVSSESASGSTVSLKIGDYDNGPSRAEPDIVSAVKLALLKRK